MDLLWTRDHGFQLKPLDLHKCLDDTPEFRCEIQQHEVSLSDDSVSRGAHQPCSHTAKILRSMHTARECVDSNIRLTLSGISHCEGHC